MVKKRIIGLGLIISALLLFHTTGLWLGESKCDAQMCSSLRLESHQGITSFPSDCQTGDGAQTGSASYAWYTAICG